MQVHGTRVGIQLPGAEVVFLVSLRDAYDDIVSREGGGGSNAEDLCRDNDVGLEAEVIVGDSQGRVLTLQVVQTADPLTATIQGHREGRDSEIHPTWLSIRPLSERRCTDHVAFKLTCRTLCGSLVDS